MLDGKNAAELTSEVGAGNQLEAAMPQRKAGDHQTVSHLPEQGALPKAAGQRQQRRELNKLWSQSASLHWRSPSPGIGRRCTSMTPPILPSCRRPHRVPRTGFASVIWVRWWWQPLPVH